MNFLRTRPYTKAGWIRSSGSNFTSVPRTEEDRMFVSGLHLLLVVWFNFAKLTVTILVMSSLCVRTLHKTPQQTLGKRRCGWMRVRVSREDSKMQHAIVRASFDVKNQRDQYKDSNEILLKDMEGIQTQKTMLDEERQQLFEQNSVLNKELDRLMQTAIANTKKEIEDTQNASPKAKEKSPTNVSVSDSFDSLDNAEKLEDIFDRNLALQQHQEEIDRLKADLQREKADNDELEEKIKLLTEENDELKSQYELAQMKIGVLEKEKIKLSEVFEENLTSITQQRQENYMSEQAKVTEDENVLRSQVVSLLGEVDELNKRLSAAILGLQQKDRRIMDLSGANAEWKEKFEEHWNQSSTTIQMLQTQMGQQELAAQQQRREHDTTKRQYQEVQQNFNRLIYDYKDLLETFELERETRSNQQHGSSKEMIEEMNKRAAQLIAAEEAITYRDKQLEDFKRENAGKEEKIKLMEIQLETYQTDFHTERDARAELVQVNNRLTEELKQAKDQLKNVQDQVNHRQIEEMQRRVNPQRLPSYGEIQQRRDNQSPAPPSNVSSQHENYLQGMTAYNNPYNNYAMPANNAGTRDPTMLGFSHAAAMQPHVFAENADQFPSMTPLEHYECPSCGMILPDQDTFQLHVPECVDQKENRHN